MKKTREKQQSIYENIIKRKAVVKKYAIILLIMVLTGCVNNEERTGPFLVIKVIDGDTILLETEEKVRLSGINTPEMGECYYHEAKQRLVELTLGRQVYLERDMTNKDKYGRLLRYVYQDEQLLNQALVREGYARVFDRFQNDTKRYDQLKQEEQTIQAQNKGVWGCSHQTQGCLYVGSKNSKAYHDPDCKYAKKIKPENLRCYQSDEEVQGLTKSKCK